MKKKFNYLIVVEGKTDIDFLSSFIDADFYSVNGSAVDHNSFNFINECLKKREVVVLTDPDYPGLYIRNKINENCNGVKNAFIRKEVSIKKNKVGVAESTKEEVLNALKLIENFNINNNGVLKTPDLYDLNLIGCKNANKKRDFIINKYNLGFCNGKNFLKRLNFLGISKEMLEEDLNSAKR